jgi:MFS transporter, FHS family, L-fucose permease
MVAGFKRIFVMSTFQASLVHLAYFGAYFLLALHPHRARARGPRRVPLLPGQQDHDLRAFLVALFAMAAGCSILETSANPYVISPGPESTATRRLNLSQAFNPVGTNIGVLLASTLILPKLADPVDISSLTPSQLHTIRAGELGAAIGPYLGRRSC